MTFARYDDIVLSTGARVKFLRYGWFSRMSGLVRYPDGRIELVDITEAELAPCVTTMALDAIAVAFGESQIGIEPS